MIKELVLQNQPKRYLVSNDRYIVMVTYDKNTAVRMESILKQNEYKSNIFPPVHKV